MVIGVYSFIKMIKIRVNRDFDNPADWLADHGIKNHYKNYSITMDGVEWLADGSLQFSPVYAFADHIDTRVLTEFALRFG